MSQLFASDGRSVEPSASASVLPGIFRLISFRIDWFDILAVQGTLKSLLQHHNSKTSVLHCLSFLIVQHLHLYVTPGKTIALTIWTFVSKVMSLLFKTLSRFLSFFFFLIYFLIEG